MKSIQKPNISRILSENSIQNISIHTDYIEDGCAFCITKYIPEYVDLAISKGAKAIISELDIEDLPHNVSLIKVPDIQFFIREACRILYTRRPQMLIGITGTSGKSSIVDFCRQVSSLLGYQSASIGTVGIFCSDSNIERKVRGKFNINLTTADIVTTYRLLDFFAMEGVDHVAFEVSSHGLDQGRVFGLELDVACFSNLSQDHLDYHHTMQEYKEAKLKIFSQYMKQKGRAIILDNLYQDTDVKEALKGKDTFVVGYGESGFDYSGYAGEYLAIKNIALDNVSQKIEFLYNGKLYNTHLGMVGRYQAINALMVVAIFLPLSNILEISALLPKLASVDGRLQRVTAVDHKFHIFVDFAHKPEALEKCLKELKENCSGRLIVVFGCGGNRDKGKRSIMGKISSEIADIVIVTDDNPRFEDAAAIRKDILESTQGAIEIAGRGKAIEKAVSILEDGDILLVAGKGHEKYQIIDGKEIYFDDVEEVRKHI